MKPTPILPGSHAWKTIGKMHLLYGKIEGAVCRDCVHLTCHEYANKYFKCKLYGDTSSSSTDWRVRWPACGKFEKREA
jgi:hypothetical protein